MDVSCVAGGEVWRERKMTPPWQAVGWSLQSNTYSPCGRATSIPDSHQREVKMCTYNMASYFARAAVTKYHKLGGLSNHYFLSALEAGSPSSRCSQGWILPRPLSLAVSESSHGLPSVRSFVLTSSGHRHQSPWIGAHPRPPLTFPLERPSLQIQLHSKLVGLGLELTKLEGTQFRP